jgi:hypothetical protein
MSLYRYLDKYLALKAAYSKYYGSYTYTGVVKYVR